MNKWFVAAILVLLLGACQESVQGPYGTIEFVDTFSGCSVVYKLPDDERLRTSMAWTPEGEQRCKKMKPGQKVPVESDGGYWRVLF